MPRPMAPSFPPAMGPWPVHWQGACKSVVLTSQWKWPKVVLINTSDQKFDLISTMQYCMAAHCDMVAHLQPGPQLHLHAGGGGGV